VNDKLERKRKEEVLAYSEAPSHDMLEGNDKTALPQYKAVVLTNRLQHLKLSHSST
jgi:hypothetical protein